MEVWQKEILQAMGVNLLSARFDLPYAKPSSPAPVIEKIAEPALIEPAANAPELFRLLDVEKAPVAQKTPVIEKPLILSFRQHLVRLDHLLCLLEPSEPALNEKAVLVFLHDIYLALYGKTAQDVRQTVFTWPPVKELPMSNTWQTAQQTFLGFIHDMLGAHQPAIALSFGSAASYLSEKPLALAQLDSLPSFKLLALEKLTFYWQNPEQKALLWQQLQGLC